MAPRWPGMAAAPAHEATMETTAYCSCGICCGWEWGITLGSLPVYLPLSWRRRASGTRTIPLLPRRRPPFDDGGGTTDGGLMAAMAAVVVEE